MSPFFAIVAFDVRSWSEKVGLAVVGGDWLGRAEMYALQSRN